MAANINNLPQRFDYARTERDDDSNNNKAATPEGQSAQPTESTIAAPPEQQGQSSGDSGGNDAGAHDFSNALAQPVEPEAATPVPLPAQFRYGLGEVNIGRPDYVRMQAERELAQPSAREPNPRLTALASTPRAENTPTVPTPPATNTTQPAKPIPMPKPSGMAPGAFTPLPTPVPAAATFPPITNARSIGGEAVRQALAADQRNSASVTSTAPTASAAELDAVDAMLADPINRQLIDLAKQNYGPADSKSWVAEAQVKLYGEARFQDMMYLHRALPWVQNAYALAVTQAYLANSQPALTGNLTNNQGVATPPSTFDINVFNMEYASRKDLLAQAFAAKFSGIPVTQEIVISGTASSGDGGGDPSGAFVPVFHVGNIFDASLYAEFPGGLSEGGGLGPPPIYHTTIQPSGSTELYVLGPDVGDHKALFDDTAVWFDPSLGFVTLRGNMKPDEVSNFDRVVEFAGQAFFIYCAVVSGTTFLLGPEGAAVLGFTADSWEAGAIRGAVQAGVGAVASSTYSGRTLTLADFGRSIFTGGVMGGLVNYAGLNTYGITTENGVQVTNWGERLTAILGRSTMQGILQQVTGGRFRDGLRNGLVSSLSSELSRTLGAEINQWATDNHIDPFIASQLRMVAQGFSSALVQTAANGGQAGIEAFLNDLISGELGAAGDAERAEINQLTAQYNVALATNDFTTQAMILNNLTDRWMNNHPTDTRAQALAQVTAGLGWTVDAIHLTPDANGRIVAEGRTVTPTFDEDGNLMPGVVDPNSTPAEQQAQLESRLRQQGYSATDAAEIAFNHFAPPISLTADQAEQLDLLDELFMRRSAAPVNVAGSTTGILQNPRDLINQIVARSDAQTIVTSSDYASAIGQLHEAFLDLKDGYTVSGDKGLDDANASRLITLIGDLGREAKERGIALPAETNALVQASVGFEFSRTMLAMIGTGTLAALRRLSSVFNSATPSVVGRIAELNQLVRSGTLTAAEIQAARAEIKEIKQIQLEINSAKGTQFENAALSIEKLDKNTTKYVVTLPNGTVVTVIPDVVTGQRIVEIKNVIDLSYSTQLKGIVGIGKPVDIILSPRTQNVSQQLWDAVTKNNGNFYRLDPTTGIKTLLTEKPTR